MRGLALFVAGALAGIAVTAGALAQSSLSPNRGVVGLNHVGIIVPDLDKAVEYYTKTMGFPEAFRFVDPQTKQVQLVYVQISQNTFVELQPANGRPLGVSHSACTWRTRRMRSRCSRHAAPKPRTSM